MNQLLFYQEFGGGVWYDLSSFTGSGGMQMNNNIEKQLQAYKKALFQSKSELKVIRF
ncbi:hypothetical protein [Paenibacillus ferrarius]|uniref:hypothetical protein n=1 Tax=Paenibacillus ferrarius TaxID=1469647 RepID=UPI003D27A857